VLFLAQLIEPPLQPGPIRLPAPARESPQLLKETEQPSVIIPPQAVDPQDTKTKPKREQKKGKQIEEFSISIRGATPFSNEQLKSILRSCARESLDESLDSCAKELTNELITNGYINSRVQVKNNPSRHLVVTLGTINKIQITSNDDSLQKRVEQQLAPLVGSVLHLPSLERILIDIRDDGAGEIQGNIGRVEKDSSKAVLKLHVHSPPSTPLQGEFELSNSGNSGSGEWRANTTLLQNNLIQKGDTALFFLELNSDGQLELGSGLVTATYSWPIHENWTLISSLGYSKKRFVEFRKPTHNFSFRTFQGLLQLETQLIQEEAFAWSASAGISANRTDSFESGGRPSIPLIAGGSDFLENDGDWDPWTRTGYVQIGTKLSGVIGRSWWRTNFSILQGLAAITPDRHLANLNTLGIDIGEARAFNGLADFTWPVSTKITLNLRAAGQIALNPLPGSMGFVVGSDAGVRGLPGQVIGGDSGWLGTGELAMTLWQKDDQSLSLIPFIGIGGVRTEVNDVLFKDTIGATGLFVRYRNGQWNAEAGWVDSFASEDSPGIWNNWILGNGLYTKLQYRF